MTLFLPRLRPDQYAIAQHPAKVKVLSMGRRWGKTVLGGNLSLLTANAGGTVAWIVPTYKNGRPLWRWIEQVTGGIRGVDRNRSERIVSFPSGGFLGIYSADSEDSIRGEHFHLIILDEAARIAETAYYDAILPTAADHDADIILISTPKGRNWFFREHMNALADGQRAAAWQAPSVANPNVNIRRAAELARLRVPERTYQQEWLAEFVEDAGVFRRVLDAATARPHDGAQPGARYVCGVDLGKLNDYTVFAVIDVTSNALVYIDRFSQIDYTLQLGRLRILHQRFNFDTIIIERNIGEMFIEQALRAGLPVLDFQTTNASKQKLIDDLSVAFEQSALTIIPEPALLAELQSYEMERTPSGLLRYSAPVGMHDDTVIALALAWYGATVGRADTSENLWRLI